MVKVFTESYTNSGVDLNLVPFDSIHQVIQPLDGGLVSAGVIEEAIKFLHRRVEELGCIAGFNLRLTPIHDRVVAISCDAYRASGSRYVPAEAIEKLTEDLTEQLAVTLTTSGRDAIEMLIGQLELLIQDHGENGIASDPSPVESPPTA